MDEEAALRVVERVIWHISVLAGMLMLHHISEGIGTCQEDCCKERSAYLAMHNET